MKKVKYLLIAIVALSFTSCYDFNREQAEKDAESKGKQTLLEAESSKKAKIEEAKADLESAKLEAETKTVRAEANAKAKLIEADANAEVINKITKAVKDNPDYLKYKQIEALGKGKSIYVSTEGNMPILMGK